MSADHEPTDPFEARALRRTTSGGFLPSRGRGPTPRRVSLEASREVLAGAPSHVVAPAMLGWVIETTIGGRHTALEITEVEAYDQSEPASHTFRGLTPRTAPMFEQAGTLYVYRSYGLHWCANVVTGEVGHGSAVLLRAGVSVAGEEVMAERRGRARPLATGPGMLTQALGIVGEHNGLDLFGAGPVVLRPTWEHREYRVTSRIGITKAVDLPWRFVARTDRGGTAPAG